MKTTREARAQAEGAAGPLVLLSFYGRERATALAIADGAAVVVGRTAMADVFTGDESLSREHARIARKGMEVTIEDLESRNGTWVNGERLKKHAARVVGPDDEVRLGETTLCVHRGRDAEAMREGLASHDEVLAELAHELVRLRAQGRPLALLMVRAAPAEGAGGSGAGAGAGARAGARTGTPAAAAAGGGGAGTGGAGAGAGARAGAAAAAAAGGGRASAAGASSGGAGTAAGAAGAAGAPPVSRWCTRLRRKLRPYDKMGLYGPGTVEVVLPDVDADEAERIATAVREAGGGASVALAFGVAGFPEAAVSPEALVDAARTALDRATARRPLQRAAARGAVPAEASGGDGDGGRGAGGRGAGGSAPAPTGGAPTPVIAGAGTRAVFDLVARVADAEAAVLITGETGTGKELVASALHAGSRRRAGPYRAVNCGAIAPSLLQDKLFGHEKGAFSGAFGRMPGLFEEASGGTVFLDEVGELSADAQAALLRVLQEGVVQRIGTHEDIAVDVRVVAATNRDLEAMVEAGAFRRDLFHRLRVVPIAVPPLRARRDEIPALARAFLERSPDARRRGVESIAADAMALLVQQPWPGNIRQLRNEIERAVLMAQGATITAADLPESLQTPAGGPSLLLKDRVRQCEIDTILEASRRTNKNYTAAAALVGLSRRMFFYKLDEYEIRSKLAED